VADPAPHVEQRPARDGQRVGPPAWVEGGRVGDLRRTDDRHPHAPLVHLHLVRKRAGASCPDAPGGPQRGQRVVEVVDAVATAGRAQLDFQPRDGTRPDGVDEGRRSARPAAVFLACTIAVPPFQRLKLTSGWISATRSRSAAVPVVRTASTSAIFAMIANDCRLMPRPSIARWASHASRYVPIPSTPRAGAENTLARRGQPSRSRAAASHARPPVSVSPIGMSVATIVSSGMASSTAERSPAIPASSWPFSTSRTYSQPPGQPSRPATGRVKALPAPRRSA